MDSAEQSAIWEIIVFQSPNEYRALKNEVPTSTENQNFTSQPWEWVRLPELDQANYSFLYKFFSQV